MPLENRAGLSCDVLMYKHGEKQCLSPSFSPHAVCRWFVMKMDPVAMASSTLRRMRQQLGPLRP